MEITSKFMDVILNDSKTPWLTMSSSFVSSLEKPMVFFFYKKLYFRISFVLQKDGIYLFLTIMDIGEKFLLLDFSDKLEFKNRLIKSLSHELKTPLNYIISTSDLLANKFRAKTDSRDPSVAEDLDEVTSINCVAKKMDLTVANIVDYSNILSNNFCLVPQEVNIQQMLSSLVEIYYT